MRIVSKIYIARFCIALLCVNKYICFRRDAIPNGNLNDSSDADENVKNDSDKDEEIDKNNEYDKDAEPDAKIGKSNSAKLKKAKRNKKSVQFADGIKPGEGTSPSGGEGDMPSPPPPKGIGFRDGFGDLRRDKIYSSRKSRKQEKRIRPPKTKKKVKVYDCLLFHLEKMFKKRTHIQAIILSSCVI